MSFTEKKKRRSIRLRGYDYSLPGAYFVTLVAWHRELLFGKIVNGEMVFNDIGEIVREEWTQSAEVRKEIEVDEFIVMPNHLHGIVFICTVGATGRSPLRDGYPPRGPSPKSIGALIGGFKSAATKRINQQRGLPGRPVWQRNYYDRVIRDDEELTEIRRYIRANPAMWADDTENPDGG